MPVVAAFELDSADGTLVGALADAGELPVIGRLRRDGAQFALASDRAYCAEYPATGFLTGTTSAANRYWSTITFDPDTYTCRTVGSAVREPFYALGSRASVITFDVPHSIVSRHVTGTQVVSWGGHDARFQYGRSALPSGLMEEIDARFGRDPSGTVEYRGSWWEPDYVVRLADALVAAAHRRADIATWLLQRSPDVEMLVMGFSEIHAAGHAMAHGTDVTHPIGMHETAPLARTELVRVYKAIDDALGRVIAQLPREAVVCIFTPKGMEASRSDIAGGVLLPELLLRLGAGRTLLHEPDHERWRAAGCPAVVPPDGTRWLPWLRAHRTDRKRQALRRRVRSRLPAVALPTLRAARTSLRRSGRGAAVMSPPDAAPYTPIAGSVDDQVPTWYRQHWPSLPAFALPCFSDGHIRINLASRERNGVVALADYRRACDQVEADLREAVDVRTGSPLVEDVLRVRAHDPVAPEGPSADLVVTFAVASDAIEHPRAGTVGPFPFPRSGSHTAAGFAYVAGPGITPGERREAPAIALSRMLTELAAGDTVAPG